MCEIEACRAALPASTLSPIPRATWAHQCAQLYIIPPMGTCPTPCKALSHKGFSALRPMSPMRIRTAWPSPTPPARHPRREQACEHGRCSHGAHWAQEAGCSGYGGRQLAREGSQRGSLPSQQNEITQPTTSLRAPFITPGHIGHFPPNSVHSLIPCPTRDTSPFGHFARFGHFPCLYTPTAERCHFDPL